MNADGTMSNGLKAGQVDTVIELPETGLPETGLPDDRPLDYVLVGGGLQSGLIALALAHHRPDVRMAIVERDTKLAGEHTWSFHETDVPETASDWIRPLKQFTWDHYDVRVGKTFRDVRLAYHTTSAQHFHRILAETMSIDPDRRRLLLGVEATEVQSDQVRLSDGRTLRAKVVIDNRGPRDDDHANYDGGFQKFWGFEVELPSDWPALVPRIMDDRVEQTDGFRFFYTLPLTRRRVLIEDTRFSDSPAIQRSDCLAQADRYLHSMTGGAVTMSDCKIVREENGVLPMPMTGLRPDETAEMSCEKSVQAFENIDESFRNSEQPIAGGYRGGWFHAATGYSFASATRFAELVATTPADELRTAVSVAARGEHCRGTFARFLNRLLFRMVRPSKRYQIFQRFYRVLPESRIARFYGHRFTAVDAMRIVVGVPPGGLQPIRFVRSLARSASLLRNVDRNLASADRSLPSKTIRQVSP